VREFKGFFSKWRKSKEAVLIAAFVQERATALDATHERVADGFIDTVIGPLWDSA
jgi:hypothetical protein